MDQLIQGYKSLSLDHIHAIDHGHLSIGSRGIMGGLHALLGFELVGQKHSRHDCSDSIELPERLDDLQSPARYRFFQYPDRRQLFRLTGPYR